MGEGVDPLIVDWFTSAQKHWWRMGDLGHLPTTCLSVSHVFIPPGFVVPRPMHVGLHGEIERYIETQR